MRAQLINQIIKEMQYSKYCEIGYDQGLAHNEIICKYKVAVDPNPKTVLPGHHVNIMTSDRFFELNKQKYDIYFIDGDHSAEQVIKDIDNCLNFLTTNGVLFLHDVCPLKEEMTNPRGCGDAYKTFIKLRTEREDLSMYIIDAFTPEDETGFGIIFKNKQKIWSAPVEYTHSYMLNHLNDLMMIKPIDFIINELKLKK